MGPRAAQVRTVLIDLSVAAGIGVVLGLLGPFGSFEMPLPLRLVYWVLLTVGGYVIFRPIMAQAEQLAGRLRLPRPAMWVAGCMLASVPMSALAWLARGLHGPLPQMSFQVTLLHYGNVLVIAAVVTLVYWLTHERAEAGRLAPPSAPGPAPAAPDPISGAASVRFLERLPLTAGRALVALEMQDHYVMAHTETGSALILMRMRDAIDELDGLEGAQVHRSWWVARAAVRGVKRDGRNLRLVLPRGLEAPVARSQVAGLQDAGWLDR